MTKLEKQLNEAFIKDLKIPDQYDQLSDQLNIKKSPKHHKYMNKPFFTKPKLIIAMSAFLLLVAGFVSFSLISVDAGVPVYKGMEVESLTEVSSAYALEEVSEPFIDEIESGLVPETTEGISYYSEQGETIRVKVNMENPNNHIILSFTLNGFMYQDLDFEEGPELNGIIQIIVEFRVANTSGIQNITIDAIKYIDSDDNNAIKDAVFDADRTIQVGILYDTLPEILEVSETVTSTSMTLDFTLNDVSSLSTDTAFLYVFDGTNIIYNQAITIGVNSITLPDLMMGHAYEYAITTVFDPLDGIGSRLFVLNQGILQTLHGVTPSITSTQEDISTTVDVLEGVEIASVLLYLNDTLVTEINETNNTYVLDNLLSNTTYELRTTYSYEFNGTSISQTSVEVFTTEAKDIPEVKVLSAVSFGNLVFTTFRVTDGDDTIESLEVLLYKDGELIQTLDSVTLTPQVNNPGVSTGSVNLTYSGIGDYLIVVAHTYNLNEGNPSVTINDLDVDADHTLRYVVAREIPELTLNGDAVVTLEVGSTYTELGATFDDSKDGTGDALISGDTVNTSIVGTYVVLYNYTDTDNNQATQLSRIVNVVDTTAPVITLVGDAEITLEAGATYTELGALVTDNYDADDVAVIGGDAVDTTALGIYTITYNFTDANGNAAAEVIRTVTVIDTTAPVITIEGGNILILNYLDTFTEPTVTVNDNLDASRTITGTGTVDTDTLGTYTITYNTEDTQGNAALEVVLTVVVSDLIAPVITLTGDAEITLEASATYTELGALVTDNYDADDVAVIGGDTVDTTALGIYTITYNFTDTNGNAAVEVIRTVTVVDTTAPVIILVGDDPITLEVGTAYTDAGATYTDNLDADGTITASGTVDINTVGIYTLTYDVTDTEGNAATQVTRTINVVDTTAPVITLVGDAEITLEAGATYTELGALVTDNYDADDVAVIGGDAVDTTALGIYTITYNFTDANGNAAAEVIRTVTVIDTTAPVITIEGGNILILNYLDTFTEPTVTVNDNLDASRTITGTGTVDTDTLGTYTITYNTEDTQGNAALEVVLTVVVSDLIAPVITLTGDAEITLEASATYTELGALVTDNYDADDVAVIGGDTVDTTALGIYTITYNFTDTNGNAAVEVIRTVTVVDTTAPVIILVGDDPITLEVGTAYTDAGATYTDNLDADGTITASGTVDINTVGIYTLTYDVTDTEGNAATQVTRTINVVDTTAPVITLVGDDPITLEVGTAYTDAGATYTDNLDADGTITASGTIDINTVGIYTLTYDVTDTEGNAATQVTRTVNVVDTTAPTADTINDQVTEAGTDIDWTTLVTNASDNYSQVSDLVITETDNVDYTTLGTYSVTVTITDENSNALDITFNVDVQDNTAPVITLVGDDPITLEVGTPYTDAGATYTDNLDADGTITASGTIDINTVGIYTLTYDVTDTEGNTATQVTRTVNVVDTTAPTADTINDQVTEAGTDIDWTTLITNASDNYSQVSDLVITETDNVDYTTLGTYSVTVTITDENSNTLDITFNVDVQDNTAPVITLVGDDPITLEVGTAYTDAGATYTDNLDADGTITASGTVDINTVGIYTLTYDVTDTEGNTATQVTRTINVVDTTNPVMTNVSLISNTDSFTITSDETIDSINLDSAGFTSITAGTSHTLTSLSDGNHTIILRDPSGNISSTYTILIDTTAPALSSSLTNAYTSVEDYDFNVGINRYLGYSGALGSDFAVVGSTHNKTYIYDLTKLPSDQYYETVITSVSDSRYTTVFGDYIIISSERHSSSAGIVIMYKLTRDINNNITGVTTVFTQNGNSNSGYGKSTAVYNDYLIVGAWSEKRVYVYEFVYTNSEITGIQQLFYLETQDTVSLYGFEVDIYGNYVAVGTNSNKIYLYEITDFSTPTYTETLISAPVGSSNFGSSLSLDNYKLVVGAFLSNLNGNNSGSAYIFNDVRNLTTSFGSIVHDTVLLGNNAGENFGYSVKLYDDILLVGATEEYSFQGGKVYIYDLSLSSSHENYESVIDSSEAGTNISSEALFGNFVSYNGNYVLIGAGYNHLYGNFDNGSAHLFRKQPGFLFVVDENNEDTVSITFDGNSINATTNYFYSDEGTYQMIVTDTAGNSTTLNYIYDVTAPVITLNGASSITLTVGDTYTELGAAVTDNIYPNDVAVVTGSVDTSQAGTYTIYYDYTDGSSNDAIQVTRTVIVQAAPGTQNNPHQISTTTQFETYFSVARTDTANFDKEYFILLNNLDFQNQELSTRLELLGHLDGDGYTISNFVISTNSTSSNIGLFSYMSGGSLKNITFNNILVDSQTEYSSSKQMGLIAGEIRSNSVLESITITNSKVILRSNLSDAGAIGLISGNIKDTSVDSVNISSSQVEYRASTNSTTHFKIGLLFGTNGGTVVLENITTSSNAVYHQQGNINPNAPGVIIGFPLAKTTFNSFLTLNNINSTGTIFYLLSSGTRTSWKYGHFGQSNATEAVETGAITITASSNTIGNYPH